MLVSWARVYVWTTISPRKFFGKSKVKKRLSKFFFLQNDSIYFNDYFLLCLRGKAYLPGKNRKEIIKTQIGQSNCLLNGAQTITHLNSLYSCGYLYKMIWSWRWRTSDFFNISLYNRKCCTVCKINILVCSCKCRANSANNVVWWLIIDKYSGSRHKNTPIICLLTCPGDSAASWGCNCQEITEEIKRCQGQVLFYCRV